MDTFRSIMEILLLIFSIGLIGVVVWFVVSIIQYFRLKYSSLKQTIEYERLSAENKNRTIDHTQNMLELIRTMVGQISVLKFREFQDKHKMDPEINTEEGWKIQRPNFETLIEDIARTTYKSLNVESINFNDLYFTKQFYETYIIQTSVMLVKQMLEKSIDDLVEYREF